MSKQPGACAAIASWAPLFSGALRSWNNGLPSTGSLPGRAYDATPRSLAGNGRKSMRRRSATLAGSSGGISPLA